MNHFLIHKYIIITIIFYNYSIIIVYSYFITVNFQAILVAYVFMIVYAIMIEKSASTLIVLIVRTVFPSHYLGVH